MQKVTLIAVGNLKEKYLREAFSEYSRRLSPLCKFTLTEINEGFLPSNPSDKQIEACLEEEGKKILAAIPENCDIIALCVEGSQLSSEELASFMEKSGANGKSGVCFIIGGSHGLSSKVKARADKKLSFSKMTFPHQLFRVMCAEQVYRAYMINTGTKYHK